jgi:hypothetical protein
MAAPSHALILCEGPKPTRPRGRIPRVARLLALAHHFQKLLATRVVETQAEIAELAKLTPARVTQIMKTALWTNSGRGGQNHAFQRLTPATMRNPGLSCLLLTATPREPNCALLACQTAAVFRETP